MKTFDINSNGGMPAYLNDLRFMESVHKDAFEALMLPYANLYDVIILSGCVRTVNSGTVTISEGWILFNGEIMRVEEQTYPEPTTNMEYWVSQTNVLTGGNKTYFDGSNHDTWKEDVGYVERGSSTPPNTLTYEDTPKYSDVITELIEYPKWEDLPGSTHDFPSTGPAARYLKDNSGMVHLSGFFTNSDPSGMTSIGRLPEGYRPEENVRFVHVDRNGANTSGLFFRFDIQTDGYIVPLDFLDQAVNMNNWPSFKALEV